MFLLCILCMCLVTGAGVIWIWFCQRSHLVGKLIDCPWQWGVGSDNVLSTGILSNATVARVGESASKTRSSQVPVACFVAVMHEETTISIWYGYTCCTAGDKNGAHWRRKAPGVYVSQQYWISVIEMVCKHHSAKECLVLNFARHRLYSVSSCLRFLPQASITCLNPCST